jgi:GNAT superfamily N-acetyltransferase
MTLIRVAGPEDVPGMARLRALTWGSEDFWRPRIADYLEGRSNPTEALAPRIAFVAADGDRLVGLVAGHRTQRLGCDGELQWIDVTPERRGAGVADALLKRLAVWFAGQGAARVCVNVEPGNHLARSFYTRHGARPLNDHWLAWDDLPSSTA